MSITSWEDINGVIVKPSKDLERDDMKYKLTYASENTLITEDGRKVMFNQNLFSKVSEGMCIVIGLEFNNKISETYTVVDVF